MPRRAKKSSSDVAVRVRDTIRQLHDVIRRRAEKEPIRIIKRVHIVLRRVKTYMHETWRMNNMIRTIVDPIVDVLYPTRLINHRYCRTSKATYIRAVIALFYRERVVGLYAAIHERISRLRRPMARALNVFVSVIERIVKMLKKREGDMLTRIVKAAAGWLEAKLEYLRVRPALFAVMRGTIARIMAAVIGRREEYYRGTIKHCSTYAIVKGLRYRGMRSVWYYWHGRWKACETLCSAYRREIRGICYTTCEDMLSGAEPRTIDKLWTYVEKKVEEVMERVAG